MHDAQCKNLTNSQTSRNSGLKICDHLHILIIFTENGNFRWYGMSTKLCSTKYHLTKLHTWLKRTYVSYKSGHRILVATNKNSFRNLLYFRKNDAIFYYSHLNSLLFTLKFSLFTTKYALFSTMHINTLYCLGVYFLLF